MKEKAILFLIIDIIVFCLFGVALYRCLANQEKLSLNIYFGESHVGKNKFTMLTVDLHFTDGYLCELCGNEYDLHYSNVLACSSRQISEFIDWVKQQDFYENTTIVLAGDHLTMYSAYMANTGASGFDRRMYFTIINAADGKANENGKRVYSCLDLYPTTLSSMGVSIEGNRLGLGVDLYSNEKTLAEEYGMDYLNVELQKNSDYYTKKLLYK